MIFFFSFCFMCLHLLVGATIEEDNESSIFWAIVNSVLYNGCLFVRFNSFYLLDLLIMAVALLFVCCVVGQMKKGNITILTAFINCIITVCATVYKTLTLI